MRRCAGSRTRRVEEAPVVDGGKAAITIACSDFGPAETFTGPPARSPRSATTMRRTTVLAAAATAVALAALTACNDTEDKTAAAPAPVTTAAAPATTSAAPSPTATETPAPAVTTPAPVVTTPAAPAGDFDPAKAVENASKEPYAVSVKMITEVGGKAAGITTARQNLNTAYTGRGEMKIAEADLVVETVTTADATYTRMGPDEKWTKAPKSADTVALDYTVYAKLLLAQGPSARKGAETRDGVPTQHLSGHIDLEQIAEIDPRTYRSSKAKGITGFDFDQWIDAQGRTRYVEQGVVSKGAKAVNKVTFTDFGPAETFAAPAGAGAAAAS
ncbi:LppX_LprAFG lipoprotein [Kitasatospora purpeofusca]|uniref:LppX_LprAFG lipoprotein n=1 Tax=Kitasatospora purpeofusca TaxID=67352 RepID=UPI0022596128|nr:LppX_LprAFG lipoprotein [Kitasatospora purpeofusca]MCX4687746.1 LppX_LprAFG lipoprotein [Kitasatospora purpeofusca]